MPHSFFACRLPCGTAAAVLNCCQEGLCMRGLFSFLVGIGMGISVGIVLVALLSPVSGEELRANVRAHLQQAAAGARKAQEERRKTLEARLKELQQRA